MKSFGVAVVFFLGVAVSSAQIPANDSFAGRSSLSGTNVSSSGSNVNATLETGEPTHAGRDGGASVWWEWQAPADGDVEISTDGSSFDTLLAVYTGIQVSALQVVASNDDHWDMVTSRVRFYAHRGTAYQVAVDGYMGATGIVRLVIHLVPEPVPRPPNDAFASATVLLSGLPVFASGTNVLATHELGEPSHLEEPCDTSVWWRWVAPVSSPVTVSTAGSSFDTLLAIYQGASVSNLSLVASNDDENADLGIQTSKLIFDAVAGQTYQIVVDGYDGFSGSIQLGLSLAGPRLVEPQMLADGRFSFRIQGVVGAGDVVQSSTDLRLWETVATLAATNGSVDFTQAVPVGGVGRFYRVRRGQ